MARRIYGKAVGTFVSPVLECIDVDGVMRQLDVNDVVERIDFDSVLDSIDINRHLDRVDLNQVLQRVDLDELLMKSDLASIVAQSSTGVFTAILDPLRIYIVSGDLGILKLCSCGKEILPPAPGKVDTSDPYPQTSMEKAVAVQRRYCGLFSKALAIFIDLLIISVGFALFILVIEVIYRFFSRATDAHIDRDSWWVLGVSIFSWFCYFWLGVSWTGQTIGMAIVGIKVVETSGASVSLGRSALRTCLLPLNFMFFIFVGWIGVVRRDGRMLPDLIAGTGMIWKWNARIVRLRNDSLTLQV